MTTRPTRPAYRFTVTETTHPHSPRAGDGARSPEYRLAQNALNGLRHDLIHDPFAYHPLPPRPTTGPILRLLPARPRTVRNGSRTHSPGIAPLTLLIGAVSDSEPGGDPRALLIGLLCALPVFATLTRPIIAFWLSIGRDRGHRAAQLRRHDWPWMPGAFASHLTVLAVVALRTRPRTAAWMWLLTAAYAVLADALWRLVLLHQRRADAHHLRPRPARRRLWHIRHTAQQEVTAQQTVTAHERSRRTLLEERTTIARELHDVVAHHMSVVAIQAEAAPYRVENPPPELERAFATIRENAVAALTELRRILGVVRAEDYEAPDAPQPTLADLDALLVNVRDAGLTVDKAVTGAVRNCRPAWSCRRTASCRRR
ncbi:histidine kinase OS=Streptomyces albaduncus OX=68172 GN=FHS32_005113 PE=4 SV=1 [Streptomyces griseoloalbus]